MKNLRFGLYLNEYSTFISNNIKTPGIATKWCKISRLVLLLWLSFCALILLVQIGSVTDTIFSGSSFSPEDFQDVPLFHNKQSAVQEKTENAVQEEQNAASAENEHAGLFSCPVEGCMSTFQRYCNLEHHMHYGKCIFVEHRHSLLDKAKILYTKKLQEGSSAQPFMAGSDLSEQSVQALPLRSSKKASHFSAKQKAYLDEKFKIGEQTGFKADLAQVAQNMRHAKHEDGSRRFIVDEFLAPQQIKSYFSRMTAKLRNNMRIPPAVPTFFRSVS